jgi:hypothetical protein
MVYPGYLEILHEASHLYRCTVDARGSTIDVAECLAQFVAATNGSPLDQPLRSKMHREEPVWCCGCGGTAAEPRTRCSRRWRYSDREDELPTPECGAAQGTVGRAALKKEAQTADEGCAQRSGSSRPRPGSMERNM